MGEQEDKLLLEAKREADWQRIANIESNLAINTLTTTRIENTLNEFMKKFDKYPVICEKVDQHDKWLIGSVAAILVMGLRMAWEWITAKPN
ncbi:MAG: hypothetical protein WC390_09205 [Sulfurimonas sp.]|jgi:hypothetical protein